MLQPNHSIIKTKETKPDYGGSKPWSYKNENITEKTEEIKNEYLNNLNTKGALPSAVRVYLFIY